MIPLLEAIGINIFPAEIGGPYFLTLEAVDGQGTAKYFPTLLDAIEYLRATLLEEELSFSSTYSPAIPVSSQ